MTSDQVSYRSLFLSDLHLGSPKCKAERLYRFLLKNTADTVYLVGDIIEGYHLGGWPPYHDMVLSILAEWGRSGIEITYIPGNHDPAFRDHLGIYGALKIVRQTIHRCIDGRRILVTHGDETDKVPLGPFLSLIVLLERTVGISFWNLVRRLFSRWIKCHVAEFENKMRAISGNYDGVICGHIHEPVLSYSYMNCGDWIHHCTAIAEQHDGRFQLLKG